jgi:hypothetical protein
MIHISRRIFNKHLIAAATIPLVEFARDEATSQEQTTSPAPLPEVIAGYRLTEEDMRLAAKFLATHEKNLRPLRETDLPNSLPPSCIFASPKQTIAPEPLHQRGAQQK